MVLVRATPGVIKRTLSVAGTIESPYAVKLASKVAGQIMTLEVREGTAVKAGQTVVRINDSEVKGQVLQARATLAEAKFRLAQAAVGRSSTSVGVLSGIQQQESATASAATDLRQATNNSASQIGAADAAVSDAKSRLVAAESNVEGAKADIQSAQANVANAKARLTRLETLFKQGYVAQQDVDDARTLLTVQSSSQSSLQQKLASARAAVVSAQEQVATSQHQAGIVRTNAASLIEDAKAKLAASQALLKLARTNRSQVPAFEQNLAALKASVDVASAQLEQAVARLTDTVLASPIDGVVTMRSADPGSYATPGQPLLTVQFLKWMYVTASVPIENIDRVKVGVTTSITLDALPGQTFEAKIAEVNPSADTQSRQFLVRMRLDNTAGQIRPGMYARVLIDLEKTQAEVTVPREAVKNKNGKNSVVTVDDTMTAHLVPVEVGVEDATTVQVVNGLEAGTQVVVLSYSSPKEGQKVKVATAGKGAKSGKRAKKE